MSFPPVSEKTTDSMFYGTSAAPGQGEPPHAYSNYGEPSWYQSEYPEMTEDRSQSMTPSPTSGNPRPSVGIRRKAVPEFVVQNPSAQDDEVSQRDSGSSDPFWDPSQTFAAGVTPPTPQSHDVPRMLDHPYALPPARVSSPFQPFKAESTNGGAFLLMPDPPMSEQQQEKRAAHPDALRPGRSPSPTDPFKDSTARIRPQLPKHEGSNRLSTGSDETAVSDSMYGVAM